MFNFYHQMNTFLFFLVVFFPFVKKKTEILAPKNPIVIWLFRGIFLQILISQN
jgi:hypothetical protein